MLSGYATPDGTLKHATTFSTHVAEGHYRPDPNQLTLSSLGMGTYLGKADADTNQRVTEAAVQSVQGGAINVLDTAINYRDQLAERAVGEAVHHLATDLGVAREGLFVSTKNGYLAPDANDGRLVPQYFREEFIETGILPSTEVAQGCHSIYPAFLRHQLDKSRQNLQLDTIDLLYLHNVAESQLPEVKPTKLMARLEAAFDTLEQARQQNKLRFYGLATWDCFRVPPSDDGYLSLLEVLRLAVSVGGTQHGFRYIQLPFSLAMPEASTEAFQPDTLGSLKRYPVLRVAETLGIGVFTSVPLCQGQLLTQPEQLPQFPGLNTPAQQCLQAVRCTPGIIAPLVGHKTKAHVEENLRVAEQPIYQVEGQPCH